MTRKSSGDRSFEQADFREQWDSPSTQERIDDLDRYDQAYSDGYEDGLAAKPRNVPEDDTEINYRDGYEDGAFKRACNEQDDNEL